MERRKGKERKDAIETERATAPCSKYMHMQFIPSSLTSILGSTKALAGPMLTNSCL